MVILFHVDLLLFLQAVSCFERCNWTLTITITTTKRLSLHGATESFNGALEKHKANLKKAVIVNRNGKENSRTKKRKIYNNVKTGGYALHYKPCSYETKKTSSVPD